MLQSDPKRVVSVKAISSELDSIAGLIEGGDAISAILKLQAIRCRISGNPSRIELARYFFLFAHAFLLSGDYWRALVKIKTALRLSSGIDDLEFYSREKSVLGAIRWAEGKLDEAISEYSESLAFIKKNQAHASLYKPLNNIGLIHFSKGDLPRAESLMREALRYATRFNGDADVRICTLNLARILCLAGSFCEAESVLRRLDSGVESDLNLAKRNCINGLIHNFRLELDAGRVKAEQGLSHSQACGDKRQAIVALEYLGLNEYFAGNYEKAREYYNQVLAMPEPTASAVAQTLRMLTDVEIAEGNWDKAREIASKAETAITKISERIELGALWRAYGVICTHDNDNAKARDYFERSIDLLRQLGARYELALSYFDAGRSKAYSQDQRLDHLRQAKALFIEMEVPKRFEQVDAAIARLSQETGSPSDNGKRRLTVKSKSDSIPVIIAKSAAMKAILQTADQVKNNTMNLLITGETGTGKDLLAEYIHKTSIRAGKPYVAVNCAAIPESMLEAELFGYARGSFTSAGKDKPGLIESAEGGTFVFDEIGEIPMNLQVKLLRAIDTKQIRRVGELKDRTVDARFIALTNRNLEAMVAGNQFRSDLYYRLNEVHLQLPPLRHRLEDLEAILLQLLQDNKLELEPAVVSSSLQALNGYTWPGNVRQLQTLAKEIALEAEQLPTVEALRLCLGRLSGQNGKHSAEISDPVLAEALTRHDGNLSRAAHELGIPLSTLRYRVRKGN